MDNDPRPSDGVSQSEQEAIEAYVNSYLTENELKRSWQVIEKIESEASRSHSGFERSQIGHSFLSQLLGNVRSWRLWIPIAGTVAVTLAVCFFALRSNERFTLHAQGSEYRSSKLPPTLDLDLKGRTAQLSGAGASFTGPLTPQTPPLSDGALVFKAVLQTTDGIGQFIGLLSISNSPPGNANGLRPKVTFASLTGILAIRGIGTNSVSASFVP